MLVQVAPGNTRPRNPENPIQNKAVIPRTPPAARTALDHERLKAGPFLVAHQTTDQVIPSLIDQNPCAHCRSPMDMMRQGWSTSLFQAKQQWSTMSS